MSDAKAAPTPQPVEETLAYEAENRPRAMWAGVIGGMFAFAGAVLFAVVFSGSPNEETGFISLPEALSARLDGRAPEGSSLIVRQVDYYGDNVVLLSLAAVLTAASVIAACLLLIYLFRATAARNPSVGRMPLVMTMTALVAFPIGHLVQRLAAWIGSVNFADEATRTPETARDVFQTGAIAAGQLIEFFGTFSLGVAFALVSLNAMRVGLLTRFWGVLGIIVGVLAVIQLDTPQLIRTVWLVGVGAFLLGGRLRGGLPPAWVTGRAEPWPSQQELREQREAASGNAPKPATATATTATAEGGESAAQRRKRKKRR